MKFSVLSVSLSLICLTVQANDTADALTSKLERVEAEKTRYQFLYYEQLLDNQMQELEALVTNEDIDSVMAEDDYCATIKGQLDEVVLGLKDLPDITKAFCGEGVVNSIHDALENPDEYFKEMEFHYGGEYAECLEGLFLQDLEDEDFKGHLGDAEGQWTEKCIHRTNEEHFTHPAAIIYMLCLSEHGVDECLPPSE